MRKQHLQLRVLFRHRWGRALCVRVIGGPPSSPVRGATSVARKLVVNATSGSLDNSNFGARNGLENELG